MTTQLTGTTNSAAGQSLSADDLTRLTSDGHRHELLDGTLLTTAPPSPLHQITAARLAGMLLSSCPETMRVLPGPAIRLSRSTLLTPDLAVARHTSLTSTPGDEPPGGVQLACPPLLVAEIFSPLQAPAACDRRMAAYAAFGIWSYWIVVLGVRWPDITVFELADGR